MSARTFFVDAIAVLAGAIIGLLLADLASFLFAGSAFLALFASSRVIFALFTVALFALYYARMPKTPAVLASLVTGIVLPAFVEAAIFGSILDWSTILLVYAVFSVVALLTYRFVHANGAVRSIATDMAGSDRPDA